MATPRYHTSAPLDAHLKHAFGTGHYVPQTNSLSVRLADRGLISRIGQEVRDGTKQDEGNTVLKHLAQERVKELDKIMDALAREKEFVASVCSKFSTTDKVAAGGDTSEEPDVKAFSPGWRARAQELLTHTSNGDNGDAFKQSYTPAELDRLIFSSNALGSKLRSCIVDSALFTDLEAERYQIHEKMGFCGPFASKGGPSRGLIPKSLIDISNAQAEHLQRLSKVLLMLASTSQKERQQSQVVYHRKHLVDERLRFKLGNALGGRSAERRAHPSGDFYITNSSSPEHRIVPFPNLPDGDKSTLQKILTDVDRNKEASVQRRTHPVTKSTGQVPRLPPTGSFKPPPPLIPDSRDTTAQAMPLTAHSSTVPDLSLSVVTSENAFETQIQEAFDALRRTNETAEVVQPVYPIRHWDEERSTFDATVKGMPFSMGHLDINAALFLSQSLAYGCPVFFAFPSRPAGASTQAHDPFSDCLRFRDFEIRTPADYPPLSSDWWRAAEWPFPLGPMRIREDGCLTTAYDPTAEGEMQQLGPTGSSGPYPKLVFAGSQVNNSSDVTIVDRARRLSQVLDEHTVKALRRAPQSLPAVERYNRHKTASFGWPADKPAAPESKLALTQPRQIEVDQSPTEQPRLRRIPPWQEQLPLAAYRVASPKPLALTAPELPTPSYQQPRTATQTGGTPGRRTNFLNWQAGIEPAPSSPAPPTKGPYKIFPSGSEHPPAAVNAGFKLRDVADSHSSPLEGTPSDGEEPQLNIWQRARNRAVAAEFQEETDETPIQHYRQKEPVAIEFNVQPLTMNVQDVSRQADVAVEQYDYVQSHGLPPDADQGLAKFDLASSHDDGDDQSASSNVDDGADADLEDNGRLASRPDKYFRPPLPADLPQKMQIQPAEFVVQTPPKRTRQPRRRRPINVFARDHGYQTDSSNEVTVDVPPTSPEEQQNADGFTRRAEELECELASDALQATPGVTSIRKMMEQTRINMLWKLGDEAGPLEVARADTERMDPKERERKQRQEERRQREMQLECAPVRRSIAAAEDSDIEDEAEDRYSSPADECEVTRHTPTVKVEREDEEEEEEEEEEESDAQSGSSPYRSPETHSARKRRELLEDPGRTETEEDISPVRRRTGIFPSSSPDSDAQPDAARRKRPYWELKTNNNGQPPSSTGLSISPDCQKRRIDADQRGSQSPAVQPKTTRSLSAHTADYSHTMRSTEQVGGTKRMRHVEAHEVSASASRANKVLRTCKDEPDHETSKDYRRAVTDTPFGESFPIVPIGQPVAWVVQNESVPEITEPKKGKRMSDLYRMSGLDENSLTPGHHFISEWIKDLVPQGRGSVQVPPGGRWSLMSDVKPDGQPVTTPSKRTDLPSYMASGTSLGSKTTPKRRERKIPLSPNLAAVTSALNSPPKTWKQIDFEFYCDLVEMLGLRITPTIDEIDQRYHAGEFVGRFTPQDIYKVRKARHILQGRWGKTLTPQEIDKIQTDHRAALLQQRMDDLENHRKNRFAATQRKSATTIAKLAERIHKTRPPHTGSDVLQQGLASPKKVAALSSSHEVAVTSTNAGSNEKVPEIPEIDMKAVVSRHMLRTAEAGGKPRLTRRRSAQYTSFIEVPEPRGKQDGPGLRKRDSLGGKGRLSLTGNDLIKSPIKAMDLEHRHRLSASMYKELADHVREYPETSVAKQVGNSLEGIRLSHFNRIAQEGPFGVHPAYDGGNPYEAKSESDDIDETERLPNPDVLYDKQPRTTKADQEALVKRALDEHLPQFRSHEILALDSEAETSYVEWLTSDLTVERMARDLTVLKGLSTKFYKNHSDPAVFRAVSMPKPRILMKPLSRTYPDNRGSDWVVCLSCEPECANVWNDNMLGDVPYSVDRLREFYKKEKDRLETIASAPASSWSPNVPMPDWRAVEYALIKKRSVLRRILVHFGIEPNVCASEAIVRLAEIATYFALGAE